MFSKQSLSIEARHKRYLERLDRDTMTLYTQSEPRGPGRKRRGHFTSAGMDARAGAEPYFEEEDLQHLSDLLVRGLVTIRKS